MKTPIFAVLLLSFLVAEVACAAIDLVMLRDSSDAKPALGTVDFSYLRKDPRKTTDRDGNIKLPPPPHDKADPIQVCPIDQTKYGACFRQQFPKDDGVILLLTRSGAFKLELWAQVLAQEKKFKPAAALTAIVSDFYKALDSQKSQALLRKALGFLARSYAMQSSVGEDITPDEKLRRVVLTDLTLKDKPAAEGAWDSLDFLSIAGETRSQALRSAGLGASR